MTTLENIKTGQIVGEIDDQLLALTAYFQKPLGIKEIGSYYTIYQKQMLF